MPPDGEGQAVLSKSGISALLAAFPQCLDEVIKRSLILRIDFECLLALNGGLRILPSLQIKLRQHPPRWAQRWTKRDSLLRRTHCCLKFWRARFRSFLCENIRLQIKQDWIVWFACEFLLNARQSMVEIVLLHCSQSLRSSAQGLAWINIVRGFKVSLGFVVFGQLHVENTARKI